MKVEINNLPDYAIRYRYIVARYDCGELWFWGAYDDEDEAREAAVEQEGIVCINEEA